MSLVRALARPLLAATFISSGIDAFLHPMNRAARARPLLEKFGPQLGDPTGRSVDPEVLVRGSGAVMAGAGVMLATGTLPRLSALALAASSVPTTYLDHPFWEQKDPERRRDERAIFLRNLGLLGGLMLASVDTEGRPGLAWRGRHAVGQVERSAHRASRQAKRAARRARRAAASALPE
jgi:putative oxidoreductase